MRGCVPARAAAAWLDSMSAPTVMISPTPAWVARVSMASTRALLDPHHATEPPLAALDEGELHLGPGPDRLASRAAVVLGVFGSSESAAYEEFVQAGGQLFVSVGYEDAAGSRKLLDRFGLGLRNLPLGQVGPEANDARAWFLNAWPVTSRTPEVEFVCRRGDYPLVARVRVGKGSVTLIGDSGFFLNRNLEMPREFNLQNIEFLRKLIPDHE